MQKENVFFFSFPSESTYAWLIQELRDNFYPKVPLSHVISFIQGGYGGRTLF
jgi:hypothetical protein